ncbi:membrane fusion protein (multidrug efflux system) [Povalibacter uvarum]|uniref:Membrane fusion protein (Multidrug efflux system) n=1 Tax=Povalibacter uvarum TaxID=732238 RepID=A0A841HTK3_9GAMM|nr:efflux RND transporter periplasmic adaptor subunit [Povalibacter uvarum]MBB6095175.1 membrane fusion protein (multidrug efflux system) [Povalibacter uvarum]
MRSRYGWLVLTACVTASGLAACGKKSAQGEMPAAEVKAIAVQSGPTELYADRIGEVRGSQEVDLRARVNGVLMKKLFVDGALVKENQPLFSIDAREYRAQVANAQAQLAAAEANLARAEQDVNRYAPLLAENAISRQVYDSAVAAAKQARAQVNATRASIEEAELGVDFATIRAPFTGRIGDAKVFEGALISAGVTQLVSLYRDDPAWVYFNVSETEVLEYRKRFGPARPAPDSAFREVQLHLSDGTLYPNPGQINFIANALDPTTGTFALRAEFPNPDHVLIPGLFARIRVRAEQRANAILIPDRSVQQQLGRYFVIVVGEGDKAEMRPVQLGPRLGTQWIVDQGLKPGDRVVVEGVQKARPGSPLKVTLITADQLNEQSSG